MEEKDKVKFISKEDIEKVINSINEAEQRTNVSEDKSLDVNKVKEVISSFEGYPTYTVVGILTTALLLLPASNILTVTSMAKKAFTTKAMLELTGMFGKECSDCNDAEDDKE